MTRRALAAICAATLAGALIAPAAATAQDDDSALMEFQFLKPEVALELATATLEACRAAGYQVAVTVVDRFGLEQVVLRDRFAGPHTISTASRKAWTAVSFRASTLELATLPGEDPMYLGLREVTNALLLGGGLPIESAGAIVGGVGVSGAPGPDEDDRCAAEGLDAIASMLDF